MSGSTFLENLAEHIESQELLDPRDHVVIGVSGGADSMALLHGLHGLNEACGFQLRLQIAHVNHLLRGPESDEDAAFVQTAAARLGLPCTVTRLPVRTPAEASEGSIEEVARRHRYEFFQSVCEQNGAGVVAVGHQADDNAETILHRILRGTGWRGLSGIPARRSLAAGATTTLVRPLLPFTRQTLLAFLSEFGVDHRQDRSNATTEPTRNRIRHVILPLVAQEVNPRTREALLRLGEQARWLESYLRDTVERTFESLVISQTDQELTMNAAALAHKGRFLQSELIRHAIRRLGVGEQRIGFANLKAVSELLDDGGGRRQVSLPGGVTVTRLYDQLTIAHPTPEPQEELAPEVALHVPGVTTLPRRHVEIECRLLSPTSGDLHAWRRGHPSGEEWLDFDAVHLPLTVRTRQAGDRFWPLGAPGTRKLSDFLIDSKVDPAKRDRVGLLCDQLGPVYVIGYRIDERVKLTAATRNVLHLRVKALHARR
jgi:tRNA(Ile)-lysidine synthase